MAAVSISLSPHAIGNMAGRRAPLSNLPNGGNSPYRALAVPMKRSRSQANAALELAYAEPPPSKRQVVDREQPIPRTPSRRVQGQAQGLGPSAHSQKPQGGKDRIERVAAARASKQEKPEESLESIRQWQRHYRKMFPSFVFYFDSVTDDARRQCSRGILALGAREERFFSKEITHVITTRSVSIYGDPNSSTESNLQSTAPHTYDHRRHQTRTINPSVLEKHTESSQTIPRTKFTFEAQTTRKQVFPLQDVEPRKQSSARVDMFQRAKEMGIKIWPLEKLERILLVMFDDTESSSSHNGRGHVQTASQNAKPARQPDLFQLIKNEQLHGPSDRDAKTASNELIHFKGPHLYIRCVNERTKPILVREWPNTQKGEAGEWPQFRSVSTGKCPFIEDETSKPTITGTERSKENNKEHRSKQAPAPEPARLRTRVKTAVDSMHMEPPPYIGRKRPLHVIENGANVSLRTAQQLPPPAFENHVVDKQSAPSRALGTLANTRHGFPGGEPMASGMQASNITSAIRSQVISSTAATAGAKAGTSREIHGLQRKVLERNSAPGFSGLAPSRKMADIATVAGTVKDNPRAAKQRAQEKMGHRLKQIHEDSGSEDEVQAEGQEGRTTALALGQRGERKDPPKPGYCENCREKFDYFDDHTASKKHRKFAANRENWKSLDRLLSTLERPIRQEYED